MSQNSSATAQYYLKVIPHKDSSFVTVTKQGLAKLDSIRIEVDYLRKNSNIDSSLVVEYQSLVDSLKKNIKTCVQLSDQTRRTIMKLQKEIEQRKGKALYLQKKNKELRKKNKRIKRTRTLFGIGGAALSIIFLIL